MIHKWLYRFTAVLLFLLLWSGSIEESVNPPSSAHVTFGVKIGMLPSGGLYQFALIYYKRGKRVSIQPITEDRMIKVGIGKWPIPGTREFHDFFAEQEMYVVPSDTHEVFDINAAIDSLWKVRFAAHPYSQGKNDGWSQGDYRPTLKQQAYIYNRYGVRGYDQEYFADSSFFQLLKDVQDPVWIDAYKSMY